MTRVTVPLSGNVEECPPLFFLDGMLIQDGGSDHLGVVVDDAVNIDNAEAIEAYSVS